MTVSQDQKEQLDDVLDAESSWRLAKALWAYLTLTEIVCAPWDLVRYWWDT